MLVAYLLQNLPLSQRQTDDQALRSHTLMLMRFWDQRSRLDGRSRRRFYGFESQIGDPGLHSQGLIGSSNVLVLSALSDGVDIVDSFFFEGKDNGCIAAPPGDDIYV